MHEFGISKVIFGKLDAKGCGSGGEIGSIERHQVLTMN